MKNNFPSTGSTWRAYELYKGAVVFPADGTMPQAVKPKSGRVFSYEELNGFVGGYIEVLPLHGIGRYMVINENGKGEGLPCNEMATVIARANGLPASDYIAGPALLCGLDQMD